MAPRVYIESFENGPGGWLGWESNARGAKALEIRDGTAISRSPWWIDYNHAPPGGGYLHLLFALHTQEGPNFRPQYKELGGPNRFVLGGFPTDFAGARVTVRLKGEVERRGAALLLLVQGKVGKLWINHVLTGQPIEITSEWSEQTIELAPDPTQWTCLGARHDRTDFYGCADIQDVLGNVNGDIILVLHPLDVVPAVPVGANPHLLRAGEDYPVVQSRLPTGWVMMDEIRIEFARG